MKEIGVKNPTADLTALGIRDIKIAYWNLDSQELTNHVIDQKEGVISDSGALAINTGEFTGRSPKDRFVVKDELTKNTVDWGPINLPFGEAQFNSLYQKVVDYLSNRALYIRDAYACADDNYRLPLRLVAEKPWSNMFANNMFLRPSEEELKNASPKWTILCAPGLKADAAIDGTRQHNFAIINFSQKKIIIGGTGYTGEIKKGIFSVLNYELPVERKVLSMHCSANQGKDGDVAIFFGLSGTGKTTLSADENRSLIGDDEHGWSNEGVFNFEGGCYAKCIDLTEEKEPQIYRAIKSGAILENIVFKPGTNEPDFSKDDITQNTRVSYPIHHICNALQPSKGGIPKNIFFLTCDAFGVLPPISKLSVGQAMYHFISGYTAKVAGTEAGITEPKTVFSACFGAPFLPLHPTYYADMLGERLRTHNANVWLVNTGWTGGAYGEGSRMKLGYTRAMVSAALEGQLDTVEYQQHPVFGLQMPVSCPNVPNEVLSPRKTWKNTAEYDVKAEELAKCFVKNFEQYADKASNEILAAAPKTTQKI